MRLAFFAVLLLLTCPAFAELDEQIKVAIEEPVEGGRYSGISNLRGWAVSSWGMGDYNLEVYIDGSLAFDLVPYGKRTDVGEAFPNYPNSDTGGFAMAFNYKDLSPGEHEIRVRAYDNAGNYNDAVTTFSTERFETNFIANDTEVNFSTSNIYLRDNRTLMFEGATIEGRFWDFNVSWDRASQGLVITDIVDMGEDNEYSGYALSGGGGSGGADSGGAGSGGADSGGADSGDAGSDGGDSGGAGSDGAGAGVAPGFVVAATCNTYVTSVSDGLVRFENGAILEEVFEDLPWFEEDPAFFVVFGDNLIVVVKYDAVLLTKMDRESGWSAFYQQFVGTPPDSCTYRERSAERPLIPGYEVGTIYGYEPYSFVDVGTADNPRYLWTNKLCPTWNFGDQLLIPDAWDYYSDFNVDPVLNLSRLRYSDGRPWCQE